MNDRNSEKVDIAETALRQLADKVAAEGVQAILTKDGDFHVAMIDAEKFAYYLELEKQHRQRADSAFTVHEVVQALESLKEERTISEAECKQLMDQRVQRLRARSERMLQMEKSLTLYVGTVADMAAQFVDAWHRAEDGVYGYEKRLCFHSWAALVATLSPHRLQLLSRIRDTGGIENIEAFLESMCSELPSVRDDMAILERMGIVIRTGGRLSVPWPFLAIQIGAQSSEALITRN